MWVSICGADDGDWEYELSDYHSAAITALFAMGWYTVEIERSHMQLARHGEDMYRLITVIYSDGSSEYWRDAARQR